MNTLIHRNILILSFSLLFSLITSIAVSQNFIKIQGELSVLDGKSKDGEIILYENGRQVESYVSDWSGKIKADLDLNKDYILEFTKEGYVTKKIRINTEVPDEYLNRNFAPIRFAVDLFKQYDEVNIMIFTQPVGFIKFYDRIRDFDYDKDYSRKIYSKINKAERELQEAHTQHLENVIAQKAAEEEAERQKQVEAQKVASEARREADEEAKRKEAEEKAQLIQLEKEKSEQRKKEEEARKEAERLRQKQVTDSLRQVAEERARKAAEEEARRKEAALARQKATSDSLKKAEAEKARLEAERKSQLLIKEKEEAEQRKKEEEARKQSKILEQQRIADTLKQIAAENAKKETEEEARRKAAEQARHKATSDSLKKVEAEKARLKAERTAKLLEQEKEKADKRRKEEEARLTQLELEKQAKFEEEKRLAEERRKAEEEVKASAKIEEQNKIQQEIKERKTKAIADKMQQKQDSQSLAEELSVLKKDYPMGKTVEHIEKYGMQITRTIVVGEKIVRVYLKVNHPWGETFYFKNSLCISNNFYKLELNN